jgi:hypothetical protein
VLVLGGVYRMHTRIKSGEGRGEEGNAWCGCDAVAPSSSS